MFGKSELDIMLPGALTETIRLKGVGFTTEEAHVRKETVTREDAVYSGKTTMVESYVKVTGNLRVPLADKLPDEAELLRGIQLGDAVTLTHFPLGRGRGFPKREMLVKITNKTLDGDAVNKYLPWRFDFDVVKDVDLEQTTS